MTFYKTLLSSALTALLVSCNPSAEHKAPAQPEPAPSIEPAVPPPAPLPAPPPAQPVLEVPETTLGSAPPDGPPNEYDQMMELVRAQVSLPNEPVDITAQSIWRIGDWARVGAQSHSAGKRDGYYSMPVYSALLRKVGGAWTFIEISCQEDSEGCASSLTLESFKKRVPDAPLEMAPQAQTSKPKLEPVVYGWFGETQLQLAFEDLPSLVPLAPGETFKIAEIARDATSSYHVVALLGAEPLHKHATHDLMVVVLQGEGEIRIGFGTHAIGPHSIVHVPRNIIHSMRNTAKTPQIAYVVFTPPFDGKDRVAVDGP